MNPSIVRWLTICVLGLFFLPWVSGEEPIPEPFSADLKVTSPSGEELMSGKWYLAWPKLRMDVTDLKYHVTAFTIIDYSMKTAISLLPQFHTYTEIQLNDPRIPKNVPLTAIFGDNPCADHPDWTCTNTGTENLSGRLTQVWDITRSDNKHGTEWIDTKLHFAIKYTGQEGTFELSNIEEGQQPAPTLFQVPPGYKKSSAQAKSTPGR